MASTPNKPLISVITVVRNAQDYIADCLSSVAEQHGVDYEHWVLDGASTDRTVEIIKSVAGSHVQWLSEPDTGIYDAMNKGVRRARAKWILFLGADDRLRPGVLQQMSTYLVDPFTIYYGDVWMTGKQVRYAGRFSQFTLARKNICQQAIFYPRTIFDSHSFGLTYPVQADWVLNMECLQDPRFRFTYVPLLVADFNDKTGQSSLRRDVAIEHNYVSLLLRYFPPAISWPWACIVIAGRIVKRICRISPPEK